MSFFKTRAGIQLSQVTLPALAKQLERIANALEEQNKRLSQEEPTKQDTLPNDHTDKASRQ